MELIDRRDGGNVGGVVERQDPFCASSWARSFLCVLEESLVALDFYLIEHSQQSPCRRVILVALDFRKVSLIWICN